MANLRPEFLIDFVPSKRIVSNEDSKKSRKVKNNKKLCGKEVRNFYEDLVSKETSNKLEQPALNSRNRRLEKEKFRETKQQTVGQTSGLKEKSSLIRKKQSELNEGSSTPRTRTELQLLQHCQDGSGPGVRKCIEEGVDINMQDQYGWTPLMCSAFAGHNHVVMMLLQAEADWTVCENKGRTAQDLAAQSGHESTANFINDMVINPEQFKSDKTRNMERFYCDVCKRHFTDISVLSHASSTVHLFNRQLKPQQSSYVINEANVGYQMMLRSGWDTSQGLGPSGEGQKYPVKTVLKRDRKGLGKESKSTAKVTHFQPRDTKAVKTVKPRCERVEGVRSISRREMRRKERRDKDWEIRLRRYMNSD